MIWVISDTHFGHESVMCGECGRPSNYAARISRGLSRIPAGDALLHLGDVCLGDDARHHAERIAPLACKKWLVRGNHDNKSVVWYLAHGWDWCADEMWLEMYGKLIRFVHAPESTGREDLQIAGHLHLHREEPPNDGCGDRRIIRLETHGYQPIPLKRLVMEVRR